MKGDVLRVGWVIQVSDLPAALSWERSFELRGHQIKVFYEALAAATKVCAADIPIHGEHRADKELAVAPLPPIPETEFTALVNQIVADEAPSQLAVVAEFGERADGMILAWGVRRSGRIELDSADYEYTRVSFSSPENIWRKFSIHGEMQIRTVSVNEAQKHVEAHRSHGQMTDPR
jgi:hypothetical protein